MSVVINGTGSISGLSNVGGIDLPQSGSVLQVVNATLAGVVSTASSTFSDTGLTLSITPKFSTSKILVLVSMVGCYKSAGNASNTVQFKLLRNSTTILNMTGILAYTSSVLALHADTSTSYLDSPATTSATTYKVQFANPANTSGIAINDYYGSQSETNSTINLMEIA